MKLTKDQQIVMDKALSILKEEDRLLIKGSAGTGKTFMLDALITNLISSNIINSEYDMFSKNGDIYCTAPTNKAVKVLKEKISKRYNIFFLTTHSALKLRRKINYKTGDISFEPTSKKGSPLSSVELLIVDEASMLNIDLLALIESSAKESNCKVIFLADHKQLNPVNEDTSSVFLGEPISITSVKDIEEYKDIVPKPIIRKVGSKQYIHLPYPTVELTKIVRQSKNNPIIDLSMNLHKIGDREDNRTGSGGYIFTDDEENILKLLAKSNGKGDIKYLAYTNREVDRINKLVRNILYQAPAKIEEGETLIFNSPYKDKYFINEEITVNKLSIKTILVAIPVPGVEDKISLKVYCINPVKDNILVIHEESEDEFNKLIKKLQHNAKIGKLDWRNYYSFVEAFADLKYCHAITIHKS